MKKKKKKLRNYNVLKPSDCPCGMYRDRKSQNEKKMSKPIYMYISGSNQKDIAQKCIKKY